MTRLLQTKTADTAHTRILASDHQALFPVFGVGPGDEARVAWQKQQSSTGSVASSA